MDTGRSISFTSLRQVNDRLFNHSVHLSSFWCEMGKQTAVGGHSLFCFSLWSALSIIEPPPFGLWCSGWPSVPPSPPIYRSPPHPDPGNGPDIGGASWRLCVPLSQPETSSPS